MKWICVLVFSKQISLKITKQMIVFLHIDFSPYLEGEYMISQADGDILIVDKNEK